MKPRDKNCLKKSLEGKVLGIKNFWEEKFEE